MTNTAKAKPADEAPAPAEVPAPGAPEQDGAPAPAEVPADEAPAPADTPAPPAGLTEADVRAIVRDELSRADADAVQAVEAEEADARAAAEAEAAAAVAREKEVEKERKKAAADARKAAEARADFAAALFESVTEKAADGGSVARDAALTGPVALCLELEAGGFASDVLPQRLEPGDFAVRSVGGLILNKAIDIGPDGDAKRISAVWIVDGEIGAGARCEIPGGITAGGGRVAELPAGSLVF